jgi:acyl-homoserine-lactone acylase
VRGALHVPIHGGPGSNGVLNVQESEWQSGAGYVPVHGSSYMQVVTFDEQGPVADAVLSYSQSTDPMSPNYADQTQLYSKKAWNRLPFSAASIRAETVSVEHVRQ